MRDTSKFTNIVSTLDFPVDERVFWPEPKVAQFTDIDPQEVEDGINALIATFAAPLEPDVRYTLTDIEYSTAQQANNVVEHSALVAYVIWRAV